MDRVFETPALDVRKPLLNLGLSFRSGRNVNPLTLRRVGASIRRGILRASI